MFLSALSQIWMKLSTAIFWFVTTENKYPVNLTREPTSCVCLLRFISQKHLNLFNSCALLNLTVLYFALFSGRSPHRLSLELLKKNYGISKDDGQMSLPFDSIHCITVPGAAAGWVDCIEKFGSQKVKNCYIKLNYIFALLQIQIGDLNFERTTYNI